MSLWRELVALREELSYLARDVEWIANGGVGQDVALREQYLKQDADRRIALMHESDSVGRAVIRDRLARSLSLIGVPDAEEFEARARREQQMDKVRNL